MNRFDDPDCDEPIAGMARGSQRFIEHADRQARIAELSARLLAADPHEPIPRNEWFKARRFESPDERRERWAREAAFRLVWDARRSLDPLTRFATALVVSSRPLTPEQEEQLATWWQKRKKQRR